MFKNYDCNPDILMMYQLHDTLLRMELSLKWFSNDCRKSSTKVTTLTNHNRRKQQLIRIPSNYGNLLKSQVKSHVQGSIGFGFTFHWLKTTKRFSSQSQSIARSFA